MIWVSPTSDWLTIQNERIAQRDARIRAIRSFFTGLFLDVSVFVATVLVTAFTSIEWTKEYWIALGGLLGKTILQSAAAYVLRRLVPPSNTSKL